MKKSTRFKQPAISTLTVLALAGSAWAISPYDTPYGIQLNYMVGISGDDGGGSATTTLDVTSDGTVFVHNRTGISTWGSGTGGNVRGGLGAITPLGQLLYGTTVSSLPTMNAANQQYAAGVNAVGNKAYFAVYGAQGQFWTGEDGKDPNRAMVWSLNSSGLNSIADQHSLSKFTGAAGNPPRTDLLQPTTTGLTPAAGQNRISASALRDSTLDMVMVGDVAAGDFGTAGDYEGYLLRTNNSQPAYLPGIAVYNFTTNTLSGPAKQPILTHAAATGSNMGVYSAAGIDQSTGRYYGGGLSHSRTESTSDAWDPDGSGPAPSIPFVTSTSSANPAGIGAAYDSSHNLLYAVTWDTAGFDLITAIVPTDDGSNGVFWAGEKLDDCHIELRDASGAVVWSDTFDMSPEVAAVPGVERIRSVSVEANGDLLVAGYFENGGAGGGANAYDTFVRKYKKTATNTYVVQWATTSGLSGVQDLIATSALDPADKTLYTVSRTDGQWANATGHLNAGGGDLLVQKLTAGDFNSDGIVDFADVQIAGTATKPGLPGVDTYDFNQDGDSTLADTTYMITNIMDRLAGDIAQDSLVSDVDNADIGKAIGNLGSGTLYLDGDIDWDGDVDNTDVTTMATAFSGAKPSGQWTNGTPGATLRYRASDGRVWIHADEAAGGIITSFQLENSAGTFASANYTGPSGGGFGGALEDDTSHVLADTDLTLAGVGNLFSLGTVFPTGMNQAGLEAYLKTAVYTGQPGSGQMRFTLLVGELLTPFESWAAGFVGLTNPFSNIDFDGGGLETGIEWIVGGDPTIPGDDVANTPTLDNSDPNNFKFVFRRRDAAAADSNTKIVVEYGSDLAGWRNTAVHGATDGVTINDSVDLGGGFHQVTVSIPKSLAVNGKLFARLGVSGLPFSLLNADFESNDGGFTVSTLGGTPWAYGAPNSPTPPEGAVTAGNGGSAKSWGTNLTGGYVANTDTSLRSPVIHLTGVASASLSFAMAIDANTGHTLTVNVIDDTTDTVIANLIPTAGDANVNNATWANVGPVQIPGPALGQAVRIEWRFVGNGDESYNGVYIDDVAVSGQ